MGALGALGVGVRPLHVRVLAALEAVLGALALAVTSAVVAGLVAVSYAVFGIVTVVALVRDVPLDTCGCLGRLETPPSWRHLVVIALALVSASVEAGTPTESALERLAEDGGAGVLYAVTTLVLTTFALGMLRAGRRPSAPR